MAASCWYWSRVSYSDRVGLWQTNQQRAAVLLGTLAQLTIDLRGEVKGDG